MRIPVAIATIVAALALAGCSSSPAAPGASTGPGGNPGGNPGGGIGTLNCAGIATFSASPLVFPSIAPDAGLLGKFPAQVAGQPITGADAQNFGAYLCAYSPATAAQSAQAFGALGVDINTFAQGSFTAKVGDASVTVSAFRTPGRDASQLFTSANLPALAAALGGSNQTIPTLQTQNIGGKSVLVGTETDGDTSYIYTTGDTAFLFTANDPAVATTVLQALP